MKKLNEFQVLCSAKDLDKAVNGATDPFLSDKALREITGGTMAQACDAVCLPDEMGGCSCHSGILA